MDTHTAPSSTSPALLGIDWGTSNRRAYLVDQDGACLARHSDGDGMLSARGRFPAALQDVRAALGIDETVPVLMSGMVGSTMGWQKVAYLRGATPLAELPAHLTRLPPESGARGLCRIVPGYRTGSGDATDVMRGEETQLLGAIEQGCRDGWVVLPGTHSKWVFLRDGNIKEIASYMTGELFAMLRASGTLAPLMQLDGSTDGEAFIAGLTRGRQAPILSNALFRVRAQVVCGEIPAAEAAARVSGLLIGAEFAAAVRGQAITVIGAHQLASRYEKAAALFGMQCRTLDPDTTYCMALRRVLHS